MIDEKTAIIEWFITDKIQTFIVRKNCQPVVLPGTNDDVQSLTNWTNIYLRDYYNQKDEWRLKLNSRLEDLAKILDLDRILEQLPQEVDQLILVPYLGLHLFPLHALPINSQQGKAKSQILLDCFSAGVSYVPSCQLLQLAQTRERPDFTHLFAVQNPTDDLSYTNLEVEAIKSFFQTAEVLASQDASEAAVKVNQNLITAHCSHFSCHGYFNLESPLKSALILAEAKTEQIAQDKTIEDGFLTLGEIFGFNLNQCRIVTLSACETGLIDFRNISDEYIGLPSGFLVAGSPAVISSLWTVNQVSTAFLMIKFYENLRNQMSLALALNQAQLWLRDATIEKLLDWTRQLRLNDKFKKQFQKQVEDELELYNPEEKRFSSSFHWAAFYAVGQ